MRKLRKGAAEIPNIHYLAEVGKARILGWDKDYLLFTIPFYCVCGTTPFSRYNFSRIRF